MIELPVSRVRCTKLMALRVIRFEWQFANGMCFTDDLTDLTNCTGDKEEELC